MIGQGLDRCASPFFNELTEPDTVNPFPARFRRVKWSRNEDQLLRHFVEVHGLGNWIAIAHDIPGRNPKQCRERWLNQLAPALSKDGWTQQEDAILVQQQRICGNVWSQITQFLPGRSPNAIKNRWFWLTRPKRPRKENPYAMWRMPPILFPQILKPSKGHIVRGETAGEMPSPQLGDGVANFVSNRPGEPDGDDDFWSMAIERWSPVV
jgi:hypothetical protein